MSTTNWQDLAATSHYETAVGVATALRRGDVTDASLGIEELIDALSRSDKRALRSHLIRLMAHIMKWHTQREKRSRSWRATIRNARREIAEIREETPSLNREFIESLWQNCLEAARDDAEADMDQEVSLTALSWEQVFDENYEMD